MSLPSRIAAELDALREKSTDDRVRLYNALVLAAGVGVSRLVVGELTIERARDALGGEPADIVYSDPPWGPGNLMYWRTHNGEMDRPNWDEFLDLFCRVVSTSVRDGGHVFLPRQHLVEDGADQAGELDRARRVDDHGQDRDDHPAPVGRREA